MYNQGGTVMELIAKKTPKVHALPHSQKPWDLRENPFGICANPAFLSKMRPSLGASPQGPWSQDMGMHSVNWETKHCKNVNFADSLWNSHQVPVFPMLGQLVHAPNMGDHGCHIGISAPP
eukprot:TRINITY_DN67728_c2_g1_i1.p2 TRINITY_DN67728_c2_g1~~TRINITY_DN67728_c2_g1_i1.p2  ORF type:complete len:120 (+),score=3.56 TRINITY_DN67728_c2_g1_i1:126-485(+)